MEYTILDWQGKEAGKATIELKVAKEKTAKDLLHRAVLRQRAHLRQGTASTLTRAEVRGGGRKPYKQKGTGRARQGDKKAPHMRGGGVAFGPVFRSHAHNLTKKVRRLALRTALSTKQANGKLVVLDEAKVKSAKTSDLVKQVKKLGWDSALIIDGSNIDHNFNLASRNIEGIDLLPQQGANVYDILRRDILVLTKGAIEKLVERLK